MNSCMNRIVWSAALIVSVVYGYSQDSGKGMPWKAVVKVVDETGQAVEDADVTIGYYIPPREDQSIALASTKGKTDTKGLFSASGDTRSTDLLFGAVKQGYYRSHFDHELGLSIKHDPVRWSPEVSLMLKKTVNPTRMYAKAVNLGLPAFDKDLGFDLMVGDWIAPHGKGVNTDIIFSGHRERRSELDFDYRLVVSFPNQGDGIQEFVVPAVEECSDLRSAHEAPREGYQPQWIQTSTRRPGQPVITNRDDKRNYYFRVRTVLDEKGNVKSALYGKIYGDFLQFTYYLNPTPNDRNVEFDPKRNLTPNLQSFERVNAP